MSVVRILLVVLVGFLFLLLSVANWTLVPFLLPDGRSVQAPLPLVILGAFLAGWLPTWLSHIAARTVLRHKLERAERQLREVRGEAPATAAAPRPVSSTALPGQAQPTIVPPAGC
ncbi:hypothetical protein GCM10007973_15340 [Polymorphobacter multimanifer]|uniref:Putative integral membrane protein n=1 Tax=Polymorphobacter multimanifer TaxID=1070431 RepID=A0A841L457_9SPHN|nr:LapA family protein [Polymorphobacter multimanifer]MBB6226231.1 putative integral membrane protein [Polymorphobacter multimanifer]GGI79696.1 hypothetical protein GCM10007973_15340 [Polymorphobacter multimanifer]